MDLQQLQVNSWKVSEDHGFHKAQLDLPPKTLANYLKLFLIAGELCEAGEELRTGRDPQEIYYSYKGGWFGELSTSYPWHVWIQDADSEEFNTGFGWKPSESDVESVCPGYLSYTVLAGKPEGFPIELADALIRLCDLAEDTGVDLSEVTEIKERYNRTREFLHGKTA